jgi:hypothetical protein
VQYVFWFMVHKYGTQRRWSMKKLKVKWVNVDRLGAMKDKRRAEDQWAREIRGSSLGD